MSQRKRSRKRKRRKLRRKKNNGKTANIRGDTIEEQAQKAFTVLKQEGKIQNFKKFAKNSVEDKWGWDFIVTMPDQRQVPVDVTTDNPKTVSSHLKPKPNRKERLVIPIDIFTPIGKLIDQIQRAVKNYDRKLPPFSYIYS